MKYLSYKEIRGYKHAFVENVMIGDVARSIETPFYLYSKKTLIDNFLEFKNSFNDIDCKICYAIKANCNLSLVKLIAELGGGIDAVSAGEIDRAIKAGIDPKKIVFAGVGKTKAEIEFALKSGVEEFSVESEPEMFALNEVSLRLGIKAKFSLRVNPNVDAKTHSKISTGKKGDKFGVDIEFAEDIYRKANSLPGLEVYGISTHIGSQITSQEPFRLAFVKIRELFFSLKNQGISIKNLDFGGGIGVVYKDEIAIEIKSYANIIKDLTKDLNIKVTIAPGRAIVASAGILVSRVIYIKKGSNKTFAVIDAAMNDLARPGLYDSYHEILPVIQNTSSRILYDVVGPVCESTDILAKGRELHELKSEDLIMFLTCGAYGSSMSNQYNCRNLIPEIMIDDNNFKVIRRRPSFDEMLQLER